MKKIDKTTLMDYLYGELSEADSAEVSQYLDKNPVLKEEYNSLVNTKTKLAQLTDESVTEPLVFSNVKAQPKPKNWQKWTAAAAIFILGLLTAAWLNIQVSFHNQELAIRFGEKSTVAHPQETTPATVAVTKATPDKTVSAESLKPAVPDSIALQRIVTLEKKLQHQIQELQVRQAALQKTRTNLTPEQVTELMSDLQQDNFETMQQLLLTSNQQQQLYSQKMLAQLTDYLASQRKEDLQKINTVLNSIVQNTDQKQMQTEVVLSQVISKLNEKSTKQKN